MRKYIPSFIYEESEVIDALLSAIEDEIITLKSYIEQGVLGWYIDTATGNELDRIGLLAGATRSGRSDADYRVAIKSKILSMAGTEEVLLNIAKDLTDDTAEISDYAPGQVEVKVNAETFGVKTPKEIFQEAINHAKVAGVHPYWHWRVLESTKDDVELSEDTTFPKHSESDDVVISEDISFPKLQVLETLLITEEVQDSHNYPLDTEVSENGAPSETVVDSLHPFPYVFNTDKFDFAEFS